MAASIRERAYDLDTLIDNLNLHIDLEPDSKFYVDVDDARNQPGAVSVRKSLVTALKRLAKNNKEYRDEFSYKKFLFAGHRASGKTTELRKAAKELEQDYHVIYIPNIEKQSSRLETEQDFLYYLIDYVISSVRADDAISSAVARDVANLYRYLEESIFSDVTQEQLISFDHSINFEGGAEGKFSLFTAIAGVFAKLAAKAGFEEKTHEKITKSIKNYFDEFMEYANSILLHINCYLHEQGKMLLLVLDGLDKLDEEKAKPLFLNREVMLPQLDCSMIVTFPIYLMYSPNKNAAVSPYDRDPYMLSMIKVHDKEGTPYLPGLRAMREIAQRRFDADALLDKAFAFEKYPEANPGYALPDDFNGVLDEAIMMSGGNLRDFFTLLTVAADNAGISGKNKVTDVDLSVAMNEVRMGYIRSYAKNYLPIMRDVLESSEKDVAVRANPEDDTLLNIFNAGLLIEYNGVRWCDIHPLVLDYIKRQVAQAKWRELTV